MRSSPARRGDGYIVGISLAAGLRGVNFHRSEGRGAQNELTGWFRMTADAQNGPVLGVRCIFGAFDFFKCLVNGQAWQRCMSVERVMRGWEELLRSVYHANRSLAAAAADDDAADENVKPTKKGRTAMEGTTSEFWLNAAAAARVINIMEEEKGREEGRRAKEIVKKRLNVRSLLSSLFWVPFPSPVPHPTHARLAFVMRRFRAQNVTCA